GRNNQKPLIFGKISSNIAPWHGSTAENQFIGCLGGIKFMEVEFMLIGQTGKLASFFRLVIAAIVKAFIAAPGKATEFNVDQRISDNRLVFSTEHNHLAPIRPTFGNLVSYQASIFAEGDARQRRGAVFRKFIRIQKHLSFAVIAFLAVQHTLVLQSVILTKIGILAFLERCREFFIIT